MTTFRLTGGRPETNRAELDGVDISRQISDVTVTVGASTANGFPRVELRLHAAELDATLADADVRIDDDTAALLVQLGWTPPKEIRS